MFHWIITILHYFNTVITKTQICDTSARTILKKFTTQTQKKRFEVCPASLETIKILSL